MAHTIKLRSEMTPIECAADMARSMGCSIYIVSCVHGTTRFFLTPDGLATDIPHRAGYYLTPGLAQAAAQRARGEQAWRGFPWEATTTPD
jgi:hypothetical protein